MFDSFVLDRNVRVTLSSHDPEFSRLHLYALLEAESCLVWLPSASLCVVSLKGE